MTASHEETASEKSAPELAAADELLALLPRHELRHAVAWLLESNRHFKPSLASLAAVRAAQRTLTR